MNIEAQQSAERYSSGEMLSRLGEAIKIAELCELADTYSVDCDEVIEVLAQKSQRYGGEGTPTVSEHLTKELSGLMGASRSAAAYRLADALNLRHRHPSLYAAVQHLDVEAFKAMHAARRCHDLAPELAEQVTVAWLPLQARLAWSAATTLLERMIIEADQVLAAAKELAARQNRRVDIWGLEDGTLKISGLVDVIDGRCLDHTLTRIGHQLALEFPDLTMDQCRAKAIGVIAHPAKALALLQAAAQPELLEGLETAEGFDEELAPDDPADESRSLDERDQPSPRGAVDESRGQLAATALATGPAECVRSHRDDAEQAAPATGEEGVVRSGQGLTEADPSVDLDQLELRHAEGVVNAAPASADPAFWDFPPEAEPPRAEWERELERPPATTCSLGSTGDASPSDACCPGHGPGHVCGAITVPLHKLRPTLGIAVHLHTDALGNLTGAARLERTGWITTHLLAELLGDYDLKIQPVIDLNIPEPEDGYVGSTRCRRAVELAMPTELMPYSTLRSHGLDHDHVIQFVRGKVKQTGLHNLVPLSRSAHRAKTMGAWKPKLTSPGVIEWTTPPGYRYEVTPGTRRLE